MSLILLNLIFAIVKQSNRAGFGLVSLVLQVLLWLWVYYVVIMKP